MTHKAVLYLVLVTILDVSSEKGRTCEQIMPPDDETCVCVYTRSVRRLDVSCKYNFTQEALLIVHKQFGFLDVVQCNNPLKLPTMRIGDVKALLMVNCLSEGVSVRQVMDHLGIHKVDDVLIRGKVTPANRLWFENLTNVLNIQLKSLHLKDIPEDLFGDINNTVGTSVLHIQELYLDNNGIEELKHRVFYNLKYIQVLDLSLNQLTDLPRNLFLYNKSLRKLYLGKNQLRNISSKLLQPLEQLEELHLGGNELSTLGGEPWPLPNLRVLYLHENQLTSMGDDRRSVLMECEQLEDLNLAKNKLTRVYNDWILLKYLHTLQLASNNLQSLQICDFSNLRSEPENGRVDIHLERNNISTVNLTGCESKGKEYDPLSQIFIHLYSNPLRCDCHLHGFVSLPKTTEYTLLIKNIFSPKKVEFEDTYRLVCKSPRQMKGRRLVTIPLEEFTCPIQDERYPCPTNCKCDYRPEGRYNVISCSGVGAEGKSQPLPKHPDSNQTQLILAHGQLDHFSFTGDSWLDNVTELNLSHNDLTSFTAIVTTDGSPLKVLDLSYNNLTVLSPEAVRLITGLQEVLLHGNPWRCTCDDLEFIKLVSISDKVNIPLRDNITCEDDAVVKHINLSQLCYTPPSNMKLYVLAGLSTVLAVCLVFRRYRKEALVYLYSSNNRLMRLLVLNPDDVNHHLPFDAFISFAHEDDEFVSEHLLPQLEARYKLCLHFRDWMPGEMIGQNVIRSFTHSRRTIVVMSPSYLRSRWGSYEFEIAHMEGFRTLMSRLIVIMYEDIEVMEVPESVRLYLRTVTYLKWEDTPGFWARLHYAMPHPTEGVGWVSCVFRWCCKGPRIERGDVSQEELLEQMLRAPRALVPPEDNQDPPLVRAESPPQ